MFGREKAIMEIYMLLKYISFPWYDRISTLNLFNTSCICIKYLSMDTQEIGSCRYYWGGNVKTGSEGGGGDLHLCTPFYLLKYMLLLSSK